MAIVKNLESLKDLIQRVRKAQEEFATFDQETAQKIFKEIAKEWILTIDVLKKITGNDVLLADNPELVSSLRNRLPYFDSMNYLQIELIKRSRAGDDSDELKKAIHISINGLATGLRNSG